MGVTHYPALWSPDFPLYANVQRPSDLLPLLLYLPLLRVTATEVVSVVVERRVLYVRMPSRQAENRQGREHSCRCQIVRVEKLRGQTCVQILDSRGII